MVPERGVIIEASTMDRHLHTSTAHVGSEFTECRNRTLSMDQVSARNIAMLLACVIWYSSAVLLTNKLIDMLTNKTTR
jgi:hypothetical protein